MPRVVLDTDLFSEILKKVDGTVVEASKLYKISYSYLTFTSLTALEVLSGLRHLQANVQIQRAEVAFDRNEEIVPSLEDYRLASKIVGDMWQRGTPIGLVDPMIAACAIRRGYGVATGNSRHYEFIRNAGYGFELENWRNP